MLSRRTPVPPTYRSEFPDEAFESGQIEVAGRAVLVCSPPGGAWGSVRAALLAANLTVIPAACVDEAETVGYSPLLVIVDGELPGALELVRCFASRRDPVPVLAVLGPGEPEGPALHAGADATLHHPVDPADVSLLAQRFRARRIEASASREWFARNGANTPALTTTQIAAAITHEIRNPLAVATMNVGLLAEADAHPDSHLGREDRAEMMRDVLSALARIEGVMSSVSALVRGDATEVHVVDLESVARKAVATTPNERRVPITITSQGRVEGLANEGLLLQVLTNLLVNALDALAKTTSPQVILRVYTTASEARVSVRDNGPGVPLELRDRIFEPLFSTKGANGTGIGLAIARQAVTTMGGALTLCDEPRPGACFRVRLRLA